MGLSIFRLALLSGSLNWQGSCVWPKWRSMLPHCLCEVAFMTIRQIYFVALGITLLAILYSVVVWRFRRHCFREQFALALFGGQMSILLFFVMCLLIGVLPWEIEVVDWNHLGLSSVGVSDVLSLLFLF